MLGLRTFQRTTPVLRQAGARRWTSGIGAEGMHGAADNAFNRERAAVKAHAAATSGMYHTLVNTGHKW